MAEPVPEDEPPSLLEPPEPLEELAVDDDPDPDWFIVSTR